MTILEDKLLEGEILLNKQNASATNLMNFAKKLKTVFNNDYINKFYFHPDNRSNTLKLKNSTKTNKTNTFRVSMKEQRNEMIQRLKNKAEAFPVNAGTVNLNSVTKQQIQNAKTLENISYLLKIIRIENKNLERELQKKFKQLRQEARSKLWLNHKGNSLGNTRNTTYFPGLIKHNSGVSFKTKEPWVRAMKAKHGNNFNLTPYIR
jgi:hypothetical protein